MTKRSILFLLAILTTRLTEAQVLGQPIVNWDFANGIPNNWTVGINSTTDLAHWEYRGPSTTPDINIGARGSCAAIAVPIASETQNNGFVIFDGNYWDDSGPSCGAGFGTGLDPAPHTAWLITEPLNLSTLTGAVLTFQQQYRKFQATMKIDLSTDGGQTWTTIGENTGVQSLNVEWKSINISSYIVGQEDVRIRFIYQGTYYWWLLDDITIYQPNQNDIMVDAVQYTNNSGPESSTPLVNLEYDQYPLLMIPPFNFRMNCSNVGVNAQNDAIFNTRIVRDVSTEVLNSNAASEDLAPDESTQIVNITPFQNPAVTGEYQIYFSIEQDETDDTPENNIDSLDYSITPFTYARDEGPMENTYIPPDLYEPYLMQAGNYFEAFSSNRFCHSVSVGLAEGTTPGAEIKAVIYNQLFDSLLVESETYIVNAADINSPGDEAMVVLHFDTPFELQNDSLYLVMVSEVDSTQTLRVARSGKSPGEASLVRFPNVNATLVSNKAFLVRMNIFPESAITGCTDPEAMNYDAAADTDDGSCKYPGCTSENADNFDPDANFDDGSCVIGGCLDPDAANYDPDADYDNASCQYPGCTDNEAVNYDPGFNVDDGSCIYLTALLEVSNISGCPPLTISVINNNQEYPNGMCSFILNNESLQLDCSPSFNYTIETPGTYTLDYTYTVGGAHADTSITIEVYPLPIAPVLSYDENTATIACNNCGENAYGWYYENTYLPEFDNSPLSTVIDDQEVNGSYSLVVENSQGCITSSEPIIVVAAYMVSNATSGCAPLTVTFNNLSDMIDGLNCTIDPGNGIEPADIFDATSFTYENAGSYSVDLTCSMPGGVEDSYSLQIEVSEAPTPELINNTALGQIECLNCDQFTEVIWNVDGTIFNGPGPQEDGGNVYTVTTSTEEGCGSSAMLIIAGTDEQIGENLQVYPNPARDVLMLSSSQQILTSVSIWDMTGRKLECPAEKISDGWKIDISALDNGHYAVMAVSEIGCGVKVFQVQR